MARPIILEAVPGMVARHLGTTILEDTVERFIHLSSTATLLLHRPISLHPYERLLAMGPGYPGRTVPELTVLNLSGVLGKATCILTTSTKTALMMKERR